MVPAVRDEVPELVRQLRSFRDGRSLWTHAFDHVEYDPRVRPYVVKRLQTGECLEHQHPEAVYVALVVIDLEVGLGDHELRSTPSARPAAVCTRKDHLGNKGRLTYVTYEGTTVVIDEDVGLQTKESITLSRISWKVRGATYTLEFAMKYWRLDGVQVVKPMCNIKELQISVFSILKPLFRWRITNLTRFASGLSCKYLFMLYSYSGRTSPGRFP